jgi:hypothetical protein
MEVQIGPHEYLCGRMPTRVQFHVARRLLPVMKGLQPLFARAGQTLISDGNGAMVPDVGNISIFEGLAALGDTLGMMPDSEADYVIDHALDAVRWKQAGRWMPLRVNGGLMVQEADDLATQLRLTWGVLVESLANFSIETLFGSQTTNGMDQSPSFSN